MLCLQETGLSSKRVAVVQKQLKFAGIQCHSSVSRGAACCSDPETAGGCAILSRFPLADVELPLEKLLATTARYCDAWILLPEGRRIFVASIYGVDSGKPDHSAHNSALFAAILRRLAQLPHCPCILAGDFNVSAVEGGALQDFFDLG